MQTAKRILFISSTRIGDAILSTGLLERLMAEATDARITIACGPAAAPLFSAIPNLERIIVLQKMVFSMHWPMLWAACAMRRWDMLVDLRNSPMYYTLAAGKRWRMGKSRPDVHRIRQLANVMGIAGEPPPPHLWINDQHLKGARQRIIDGPPVLAIGPAANWQAKTWRASRFRELVQRLCADDGILPNGRIAIFGRDDERPMVLELIEAIPGEKRIDLVGELDLLDAFACLQRCAFYVGNDSGLMHLAAAAGIPTLGLFGPSQEKLYAPWGPLCATVRGPIPFDDIFPANFNHLKTGTLMDSLSVDSVENAARNLWTRSQTKKSSP